MDENWIKWTLASVLYHFSNKLGSSLPIYGEWQDPPDPLPANYALLRIEGPDCTPGTENEFKLTIFVSILVRTTVDSQNEYTPAMFNGKVLAAYTSAIAGYKFGDDPLTDDKSLWCCYNQDGEIHTYTIASDPNTQTNEVDIQTQYNTTLP